MCDSSTIEERYFNLLFGVRRSIRYHNRQRLFFERWSTAKSLCAVILGSATVASVLAKMGSVYTLAAASLSTFMSAADLVVGTAKAARLHADLARRFIQLEKELIPESSRTRECLDRLESARLTIEADEPSILRVLDSICHNELLEAMGYDDSTLFLRISPFQRLLANVVDVYPHKIKAAGKGAIAKEAGRIASTTNRQLDVVQLPQIQAVPDESRDASGRGEPHR